MIMPEWRGWLPHEKVEDYFGYLKLTGLPDYAATPGHRGTRVLLDRDGDRFPSGVRGLPGRRV